MKKIYAMKLTKRVRASNPMSVHCSYYYSHVGIIESRLRSRDKKSAFQKNLERLKRKGIQCLSSVI